MPQRICSENKPGGWCDHPGWAHAKSLQEIDDALKFSEVRSITGHVVRSWEPLPGEAETVQVRVATSPQGDYRLTLMLPYFGYQLIKDYALTDEEVDAALASIAASVTRRNG